MMINSQFSPELEAVLVALQMIDNQADLNVIADSWKRQMTYIGNCASRGLRKGDTVRWEYGGIVKEGVIIKLNRKTMEVMNSGASSFARTVTKIQNSMVVKD